MTAPIKPGDVLRLAESQYLYGVGDLVLRVVEVGGVERLSDGDWLAVKGMQLGRDGSELSERDVLARLPVPGRRAGA
jgi:hypothetical protein